MNGVPGLVLPLYYRYYSSPVKIVSAPDGGAQVWRVDIDTGRWKQANDLLEEIVFAVGGDIFSLSAEQFVQEVEAYRGRYLSGEGPIFALYETVNAILDAEERENRHLTDVEKAIVVGIRRRTFVMFEEQLQREGDPGADPSLASSAH